MKAVARWSFFLLVTLRRLGARRRRTLQWTLGGDCQKCAACCERPSIHVDWLAWNVPFIRAALLWWQREVNGFELVAREHPRVFVFQCSYFDTKARRCTSYESRPGMCRDYPRFLLEQAWPEFLPGCGYRPVVGNSARMLRVLNRAPLSEEKRAELRRRMRLE